MLVFCVGACSTRSSGARCSGLKCLGPISPPRTLSLAQEKADFEQIVTSDPSNRYGWYNLGVIAQGARDSKSAAADFERAIAVAPNFESPLYQLGLSHFRANDIPDAVTDLSRAVAANPKDAYAHWYLGLALERHDLKPGDTRPSREMGEALKLDPALLKTFARPADGSRRDPNGSTKYKAIAHACALSRSCSTGTGVEFRRCFDVTSSARRGMTAAKAVRIVSSRNLRRPRCGA
jgi:tetratricopeptide (TPR) repeat protein